mgnify:CR=1 FL=1
MGESFCMVHPIFLPYLAYCTYKVINPVSRIATFPYVALGVTQNINL